MSQTGAKNLTGTWHGRYSYAGAPDGVAFTADIIEIAGQISGGTVETAESRSAGKTQFTAVLDGRRSLGHVAFTKTYDGSGGWHHSVDYDGVLSLDATEIEGRWRIRGEMTGRFMMIRPQGRAQSVTKRVAEKV